ncbi:hypothetical protein OX284_016490 [Flavobacterium sp. SUN046]|uniref:hypothetical protein n=1 Tax=Flavobacterium sp. SUN046 TaxID=3002440 RepID=UPI002DBBB8F1|nr:hypothetical protein [Flavobacterium sp. SUN046]MEC4051036.1 hypothetical protein [Flavobacterium sp. SUN046]
MNSIVTYTKEVPLVKTILGFALLGVSVYGILRSALVALVLISLGLNLIATEGAEINLDNKTYRTIKYLFGMKFGSWKPIPNFDYVSVFKTVESQRINAVAATAVVSSQVIHLNLFYQGNKHITFYKTTDKNDAFKVAQHIASCLDIDLIDATL